jgi:transaldolase / glucose-6-phosphate isomerase
VATTTGFGPRYLHSTGQLHKGGPNDGVFIQVVDAGRSADVPIPGRPYTFGTLIDAQALGDLRSLRGRGRRVARVTLEQLIEVG